MGLNLAHKIFGIALVVLVLLVVVAVSSVTLTEQISDELDGIASRQLPLSDTISSINVKVLEQGLLLQQLFSLHDRSPAARDRVEQLGEETSQLISKAHSLFREEERSEYRSETIFKLHSALKDVENAYRAFELHALELLTLHIAGQEADFAELLPDLIAQQDAIDQEITALRLHMETAVDEAVKRADQDEKFLLYFNAVTTGLAAILSLGFAALVTSKLVKTVRRLVEGAEAVEGGDLDVQVPVVSRDEVGRLTLSFNEMVDGLRMKERIKDTFGKYMDPRIVSRLLEMPELTKLGGDRREMTVMFIDLKGYTTLSEKLPPDDLVRMLNLFLGRMVEAISKHDGVVNDFLGDAVMAYWGQPFTSERNHAQLACAAALEAAENFENFRAAVADHIGEQAEGLDLGMRIGISTGQMIVGNIGSPNMLKYSVIGDPVNLGARLESANKNYGTQVMIGENTRRVAGDSITVRELDLIRVKGKAEPTRVFELLDAQKASDLTPAEALARAQTLYRTRNWDDAEAAFHASAIAHPGDPVPGVFLDRIAYLRTNDPGPDWDGVWTFETK
ncbi:MAG: adenylate/guanylate cyclase domain-containing protein [Magnetovibrionaceae bacterium]